MLEIKINLEAKDLAAAIFALADALDGRGIVPKPEEKAPVTDVKTTKTDVKTEEKAPVTDVKPAYTPDQIREMVLPLSEKNGAAWLKAILVELGAPSISKLDPAKYGALLEKVGLK